MLAMLLTLTFHRRHYYYVTESREISFVLCKFFYRVKQLITFLLNKISSLMKLTGGTWELGEILCDSWVSLDILLCTASILSLCAISIDR